MSAGGPRLRKRLQSSRVATATSHEPVFSHPPRAVGDTPGLTLRRREARLRTERLRTEGLCREVAPPLCCAKAYRRVRCASPRRAKGVQRMRLKRLPKPTGAGAGAGARAGQARRPIDQPAPRTALPRTHACKCTAASAARRPERALRAATARAAAWTCVAAAASRAPW